MPSALPPSILSQGGAPTGEGDASDDKPRFVQSQSGATAAHPDDIVASCRALQAHVARLQADAAAELAALDAQIRERELAEKRRVAPGWLDNDTRLLEPERAGKDKNSDAGRGPGTGASGAMGGLASGLEGLRIGSGPEGVSEMAAPDAGAELDKAFGSK
jgi:hypothetical protein